MKKVIRKGVLMVGILSIMTSYANKVSYTSTTSNIKKTIITLKNVKEGELLSIKDKSGLILYKELIKKTGAYSKGFDLTSLPDGDYIYEIEKDMEIKTVPFNVSSNQVAFNKENETTIHKPYAILKKNYIRVNKLALNEEPLVVSIFYVNNNGGSGLIHSETIKGIKNIEKIYKLRKYATGNYIVVLNSDNRTYYEYFVL